MNFVEELRWRGMIHDIMPGTEEQLQKEMTTGYIGFDPTADSLHIGNLVGIMLLKHFQLKGHRPVVLIGGATGMIGDPSGKSQERNLLDEKTLRHNQEAIKQQLMRFLDFNAGKANDAILVNNYDWMKDYTFLAFIRDIGKHITVNYMMAKESVKKRLDPSNKSGMSFTEFSYQLVQGTDFLHLYETYNCKLQMGGSDQWGNIVTGTELIRRKLGGEAYALTSPLITKADGGKFGKTESGNVWLDPQRTSPYKFYQYWLNVSDEDAEKFIRIFTLLPQEEIDELILRHREAPHQRLLQKRLASEVTTLVHGQEALEGAEEATRILFGKGTTQSLKNMDETTFLDVFSGVSVYEVDPAVLSQEPPATHLLSEVTGIFPSKGEFRRLVKGGGVSINKNRITDPEMKITKEHLLSKKYILIQKGKKNYYLIKLKN